MGCRLNPPARNDVQRDERRWVLAPAAALRASSGCLPGDLRAFVQFGFASVEELPSLATAVRTEVGLLVLKEVVRRRLEGGCASDLMTVELFLGEPVLPGRTCIRGPHDAHVGDCAPLPVQADGEGEQLIVCIGRTNAMALERRIEVG